MISAAPHLSPRMPGAPPARLGRVLAALALAALLLGLSAERARAEYRAYELEVVDVYDCTMNKRERCRRDHVRTGLAPDTYQRTHGGATRIAVLLLATWMCYGDTSNYEPVCPRPAPRNGKFATGEPVSIKLARHITNGWKGVVEVAYYQHAVRSNVYGVRFPERQNVYARYYEKDLEKAAGTAAAAPAQGQPAQAQEGAPAQAEEAAPAAAPAQVAAPEAAGAPAAAGAPTATGAPAEGAPPQSTPPQ